MFLHCIVVNILFHSSIQLWWFVPFICHQLHQSPAKPPKHPDYLFLFILFWDLFVLDKSWFFVFCFVLNLQVYCLNPNGMHCNKSCVLQKCQYRNKSGNSCDFFFMCIDNRSTTLCMGCIFLCLFLPFVATVSLDLNNTFKTQETLSRLKISCNNCV